MMWDSKFLCMVKIPQTGLEGMTLWMSAKMLGHKTVCLSCTQWLSGYVTDTVSNVVNMAAMCLRAQRWFFFHQEANVPLRNKKAVWQSSTVLWGREVVGVLWKNVGYAHQATFQGRLTFQGTGYKEKGEGKGCSSYVDDFGCRLVAFAGGNPPGSVAKPPEGHSNQSRNTFSLGRLRWRGGSHKLN